MPRAIALIAGLTILMPPAAAEEWNTLESRARWTQLSDTIFGAGAKLERSDGAVVLDAPTAAQDAALVPLSIQTASDARVKALDLVIDQNPSPLAAKIAFGSAGDPRQMRFRVRVDGFTNVHAVATTDGGKLLQTVTYVQAAGGCSSPVAASDDAASAHMGEMRMKFGTSATFGAPEATLMIRHPNFNGMQMSSKTHALTPARYIKSIAVTRGGKTVFTMTSDISLATNPVIGFLFRPGGKDPFKVTVVDTADTTWTEQFDVDQTVN